MSDYLLQTRNLELAYGPFKAVAGIDLNVRAGTIHTVIGPNGAGKTSLFHCLTGERQATAGKILLNGQDIIRKPSHGRVALGMARSSSSPACSRTSRCARTCAWPPRAATAWAR